MGGFSSHTKRTQMMIPKLMYLLQIVTFPVRAKIIDMSQ